MPTDLHVQFRLPAPYARKLKALAAAHSTSHSLVARSVLIDVLDSTLREDLLNQIAALQEELAALRAALGEQAGELKAFRAEFHAALRKASAR